MSEQYCRTNEMVWVLESLSCKPEDQSLSPRVYLKRNKPKKLDVPSELNQSELHKAK